MTEVLNENLSNYKESLKSSTRNFSRRLMTILIEHRICFNFNLQCISRTIGSLEDISNAKTVVMSQMIPLLWNEQFYNIVVKTGVDQKYLIERIWEMFITEYNQLDLTEEDKESFMSALVRTPTEG